MITLLYRSLLIITAVAAAITADAQMRRVMAVNSTAGATEMTVYDYDFVDSQPQFPGGDCAMFQYINNERRYPSQAYQHRIQGRVLCSFVVNTDGSISNVTVVRGVEESLNREAMRIISEMPQWNAGKLNGQPVPVYCILPIAFRL